MYLKDSSGKIQIWAGGATSPPLWERLLKGGLATVIGVLILRTDRRNIAASYRVVLCDAADIQFARVPPHRLIALSAGAVVLGGVLLYLWIRRRHAEGWVRELATITNELALARDAAMEPTKVQLRFQITDQGIGIGSAVQRKLFTLVRARGRIHDAKIWRAGLGLAICMQLVRGMGAEIDVESNPGEGSEF